MKSHSVPLISQGAGFGVVKWDLQGHPLNFCDKDLQFYNGKDVSDEGDCSRICIVSLLEVDHFGPLVKSRNQLIFAFESQLYGVVLSGSYKLCSEVEYSVIEDCSFGSSTNIVIGLKKSDFNCWLLGKDLPCSGETR